MGRNFFFNDKSLFVNLIATSLICRTLIILTIRYILLSRASCFESSHFNPSKCRSVFVMNLIFNISIVQFFRIFVLELKSGRREIDSKFDKDISRRSANAL